MKVSLCSWGLGIWLSSKSFQGLQSLSIWVETPCTKKNCTLKWKKYKTIKRNIKTTTLYDKNSLCYLPSCVLWHFSSFLMNKYWILLAKKLELVSKEFNHFGVIAGLFRQIGDHSSIFVLFCSFWRLFTIKMIKSV